MDMKFDPMIMSRDGRIAIVRCNNCQVVKDVVFAEHNRTCKRQSVYIDKYLCVKYLRKNEYYRKRITTDNPLKGNIEWSKKCSKVAKYVRTN